MSRRERSRPFPTENRLKMRERKLNRLEDYDYSQNGYYFVTVCTKNRREWFGKIENGAVILNEYGKIVEQRLIWLKKQYPYVKLDECVVMPNHVHGILIINNMVTHHAGTTHVGTTLGLSLQQQRQQNIFHRQKNLLSKSICAFKTTSSKLIHNAKLIDFQWQRSFYDHIIRNEKSLHNIRQYITNNPMKWELDIENQINNEHDVKNYYERVVKGIDEK